MSEQDLRPADDDEPLYLDEHGVPMLFDVVIPGDYLKTAGIELPARPQSPAAAPEALEARLEAAIAAALPKATERAAQVIRDSLLAEVQLALGDKPEN